MPYFGWCSGIEVSRETITVAPHLRLQVKGWDAELLVDREVVVSSR
jgi:hypothetical protein